MKTKNFIAAVLLGLIFPISLSADLPKGYRWKNTILNINAGTPPALIWVTDNSGRRTGFNPSASLDQYGRQAASDLLQEIPYSQVAADNIPGYDTGIPQSATGWSISIYDAQTQDYILNVGGTTNTLTSFWIYTITKAKIKAGQDVPSSYYKVLVESDTVHKFIVHYSGSSENTVSIQRVVDTPTLLQDVQTACQLGLITPSSACPTLQTEANAIDAAVKSGDITTAANTLSQFQATLSQCSAGDAVTILTEESQVILSALPTPTVSPSPTATNTPGPICLSQAIVAASGSVLLNSGALVDSYNSGNGAYGNGNGLGNGDVQASQDIQNNGGTIHGQQYPNTTSTYTPIPTPSANLTHLGNLTVNSGQTVSLQAGSYLAGDVNVNSNGILNAQGPVLVWYTGNLNLGGQVSAASGKPNDIWFIELAQSGNVNFNGGSVTQAVIFAPNAQANLTGVLWGSLVAASANLNSGAHLAYDESLKCQ